MRLFVAAELPGEMLEALAETSAALREAVRGRYVAPDSFHVTLAFLGEVEGSRVPAACDALRESCAGYGPIDASLRELGCFGRARAATLWQGVNAAGLSALAQDVRRSLRAAGVALDEKAFLAHVTLMRAADLSHVELPMPHVTRGAIDTVTLFKSDLSGARPVYEPIHSVALRWSGCC